MPTRAGNLIARLELRISAHSGRRITATEIARTIAVRPENLSKWKTGTTQLEQVEWLLRLLEMLPIEAWSEEIARTLTETSPSSGENLR
jgi:hypothetical protein